MWEQTVDAVEDFVYDTQNASYNRAYKSWRRHAPTSFMYRYHAHVNEVKYTEGRPAERDDAESVERRALMRCSELIGFGLLIFLCTELFGSTLLIWLFRLLGVDIRLDFLTLSMQGSQWPITAVRALRVLVKFGLPAIILIRMLRLPAKVCVPVCIGGLPETALAAGLGMLCTAVYTVADNSGGVELAQQIFEYKDSAAVIAYALFDVFIASALAELLLRGAILQALRQFGDVYAVLLTAIIGFLLPNPFTGRVSELLIGLCSGYLMLKGGSLVKCIILRTVYSVLVYARLVTVYATNTMPLWSFVLLLISVGAIALSYYVISRRTQLTLRNRRSRLSWLRKLAAFSETVTTLPWAAASALVAVIQIFF